MRKLLFLLVFITGCQTPQTVVIIEPDGFKRTPKVKVEFRMNGD